MAKQHIRAVSAVFAVLAGVAAVLAVSYLGDPARASLIERGVLQSIAKRLPTVTTPFGEVMLTTEPRKDGLFLKAECAPCSMSSPKIAAGPLQLAAAKLEGLYKNGTFVGTAAVGKVTVSIKAAWRGFEGEGTFSLPKTDIAQLYRELASIVPESRTATIAGKIEGSGTFSWPGMIVTFKPKVERFSVDGLVDPAKLRRGAFRHPIWHSNQRHVLRASGEGSESWVPLSEMGSMLPAAVIASEDGAFHSHPGYDLAGMLEASQANRRHGKIRRGGSTITQQLAKNLFLNGERTYSRKLRELLYAVELDRELGKRRVLEMYLNIVHWGPGIYGAREAADRYFGTEPHRLEAEKAAWLASILRNPVAAWENQVEKGRLRTWRAHWVLERMSNLSSKARREAAARQIVFAKK